MMHPRIVVRHPRASAQTALVLVTALLLGSAATVSAAPASAAPASRYLDVPGAHIVSAVNLTERTVALTVETPSLPSLTVVEVMLPAGYDSDPTRAWPVTYYLAGTGHSESSFRAQYGGESLTASYPSIVVSPDGDSGYWSDWYNYGFSGGPRYETFLATQLIPLINANFQTLADRSHRAILGESMGGYGAMMTAARHPDLFVAAASLSGVTDSNYSVGGLVMSLSPILQAQTLLPDTINGARLVEEVRWRGDNPVDLASNLRGMSLQIRTGNGVFNAAKGEEISEAAGCALEGPIIRPESLSLHHTLSQLGISHAWQDYSWGCHSVALFKQEIKDTLPGILAAFGLPAPAVFEYRAIDSTFDIYGWVVSADPRRSAEFMSLSGVSAMGVTVAGSGTTSVTTDALFTPLQEVSITMGGTTARVTADTSGRIAFSVDLGPANTGQQFRLGTWTAIRTVQVTFS